MKDVRDGIDRAGGSGKPCEVGLRSSRPVSMAHGEEGPLLVLTCSGIPAR